MAPKKERLATLTQEETQILMVIALLPPPVSLDLIVGFTQLSPVSALNALNNLQGHKWIGAYSPQTVGHYTLTRPESAHDLICRLDPKDIRRTALALIAYMESGDLDMTLKALIIANISYHTDTCATPELILSAAEHCRKSGATEAATAYYSLIINGLPPGKDKESEPIYIDAVLGIVSAQGHRTPLKRQRQLLSRALMLSKKREDKIRLCRVDLHLAQVAKREGLYEEAEFLNKEAWELAKQLNIEDLSRQAALFTSDFLFWQGNISKAVKRYEDAIGDLERFPDDAPTLIGCATLGWCYGICGQTARGISLINTVRIKAKEHSYGHVIRYADIVSALTLLDARRIKEAEIFLDDFFRHPEKDIGNYELWAGYALKGFFLYARGDLDGCYAYQKKAYDKSSSLGWYHHRGPWNFEYMEALENVGIVHPHMNIDSEIERLKNWPDIYMRGVGLRYQAGRELNHGLSTAKVAATLEESIRLLTESGAKIELAHAQVGLARIKIRTGATEEARRLLNEAWTVFSDVNATLFPEELLPYVEEDQQEDYFLQVLSDVGETIGTVRGHKRLMKRIIALLLKLTKAGRGGIFLTGEKEPLRLMASRNLDVSFIYSPDFKPGYIMVQKALKHGNASAERSDPRDSDATEHFGSGWRIAVPIKHQNQVLGVIYLDNDLLWSIPPKECLMVVKIVASQLAIALENAHAYQEIARLKERLEDENRFYREACESLPHQKEIIGESKEIRTVLSQARRVGPTDTSVLIVGETGSGKELVAKAIHRFSNRLDGPFIPVNSAALDQGLIASELFGHEQGAFTGALNSRRGRFELADGGTLFLDDIDTLSLEIQAKILRTLQEKEFERLGSDKTIRSDFRLVAATNQNLEKMVAKGKFRRDLYYRLNAFPIQIPPLRDRKSDIPLLVTFFLNRLNQKFGKRISDLNQRQSAMLMAYDWPGNVRELEHVIERAVILSNGKQLDLSTFIPAKSGGVDNGKELQTMREMERNHIIEALKQCSWKVSGKSGAAEKLELNPSTLYARMRKLKIQKKLF